MISLLNKYDFDQSEYDAIDSELENTDSDQNKFGYYEFHGNSLIKMRFTKDSDDDEIIHLVIEFNEEFEDQIKFIDLVQCSFRKLEPQIKIKL